MGLVAHAGPQIVARRATNLTTIRLGQNVCGLAFSSQQYAFTVLVLSFGLLASLTLRHQ